MSPEFEKSLRDAYEGRSTFDQVVRAHRRHFRALAASIMRRWRQPVWVTLEDVEQDVLLGAYNALWKFEDGWGPTLQQYLVYNAYDKAKKAGHKHRNAKRSGNLADSNPGRMERGYGAIWGDDGERRAEEIHSRPATQDGALERAERLARHAKSEVERIALRAALQLDCVDEWLAGDDHALAECALRLARDGGPGGVEALRASVRASMAVAAGLAAEAA